MDCKTEKAGIPDYAGMKQMLDYLKVSYWLVDPDYVLMDVNETFLRFTGGKREKLIGRNILTLVQPEEAELIKQKFRQLTESQSAIQFELYVYGPRNRIKIPALFHLTVNRDASRRVISFNMLISDISIQKNLEKKEQELFHARRKLRQEALKDQMIGASKSMEAVIYSTLRCAEVDSPVLITGETGVGKEVVARAIHSHSIRHKNPFVAVNCGSLPGELLESELFGHVKGAFTGADRDRKGIFVTADGGTLLLDEIGDISPGIQTKLLRALQDGEIRPVGSSKPVSVNVRILASTNQPLEDKIKDNSFREDLYYRLNVLNLSVPALRERKGDIALLAHHFLQTACKEMHAEPKKLSPEAVAYLTTQPWPGNVRELQNFIRRLAVFSSSEVIDMAHIRLVEGLDGTPGEASRELSPYKEAKEKVVDEFTRAYTEELLVLAHGNISEAARQSGLSRVALQKILKRLNIHAPQFK